MSLNEVEIGQVLAEITPILERGWIQKIQQPSDRVLIFEIRVPGRTSRLLASCEPQSARLHLTRFPSSNPRIPRPFCQFLRAHLLGSQIDRIEQVSDDRIVTIHILTKNGPRTIVCELTGRSSNVIVLDEHQQFLRALHPPGRKIGQPYQLPEKRETLGHAARVSRFGRISTHSEFPISTAIDFHYREKESGQTQNRAKEARLRELKKALKREQRRIATWRNDLAKAANYQNYARYGELIKANLGTIKKGLHHITLVDYYDESLPEVTIPLDPTKSAHGNMDNYFRKHRKFLVAERELKPRIGQAEHELERLREALRVIEQGLWAEPAPSLTALTRSSDHKPPHPETSKERSRRPFRRFLSADGLPIFVGRTARENDELTFGLAKGDDLWLHARGTPGSHVVIRLKRGSEPPPETLRDAAVLALFYSDLRRNGRGEVIYTRRKWVKKAKGLALGAVIVSREKSLHIGLDRRRLEELKSRAGMNHVHGI